MNEDSTNGQSPTIAQLYALMLEMRTEMGEMRQETSIIKDRMTTLEEFAELRRYDTRPIWESLSAEIDRLRVGQEELRAGQEGLRAGQEKMFVEIAELRAGQEELRAGQEELRAGQEAIKEELIRVNHHLRRFDAKLQGAFGEVGDLRADFNYRLKEFEGRIEKLEPAVS